MNQYVLRPMVYSIINPWSIHIIVRSNFTRNFVGQNSLNKLNKFHQTNPPFDSHSCIQSAIQSEKIIPREKCHESHATSYATFIPKSDAHQMSRKIQ